MVTLANKKSENFLLSIHFFDYLAYFCLSAHLKCACLLPPFTCSKGFLPFTRAIGFHSTDSPLIVAVSLCLLAGHSSDSGEYTEYSHYTLVLSIYGGSLSLWWPGQTTWFVGLVEEATIATQTARRKDNCISIGPSTTDFSTTQEY